MLGPMLGEPDVQFLAICDTNRSRREMIKNLVDAKYGNKDCAMFRDIREFLPERTDLDAVVIDLQDVGSRYYTYVWTAALTMKVAASVGTEVVVLDRPKPLGGVRVEGAPQREGYLSFVGLYPVAVRHGLTIGELLRSMCSRSRSASRRTARRLAASDDVQ